MNNINENLNKAIAFHSKLTRSLPMTNYNLYCRRIHKSPLLSPSEKFECLLNWEVNPSDYTNPTLFGSDWQLKKFLAKLSIGGVPDESSKVNAYAKFQSAETRCKHMNDLLTNVVRPQGLLSILPEVSRIVKSVLGSVNDFINFVQEMPDIDHSLTEAQISGNPGIGDAGFSIRSPEFGPGVSVGRDGKLTSLSEKIVLGTVTAQCAYLANWVSTIWRLPNASIVNGSVLTFVPKRVGEARTICYEPSMNMLVQKLIGLYIKKRMKFVLGIDLSDQTKNKEMARLGSLTGAYATIDLSSASDLISTWFVTEVTPYPWLRLLNDARSKNYFDPLKKAWCKFEKFSTMGNGFTFELETLLFAAITLSAVRIFDKKTLSRSEYAVYGDDIIIPSSCYLSVQQCLVLCGHIPNLEKTFSCGPFRESCGGDFFNGWEVTPIKLKDLNLNDPQNFVSLHNRCFTFHGNPNHVSYLSGWFDRLRMACKLCAFNIEPRLSEGPIERITLENGYWIPCSSDRYLWSDDNPSEWRNTVYSKVLHQRVPVRLLIRKAEKVIEYMMHNEVLPYCTSLKSGSACRIEVNVSYTCKRNSAAFTRASRVV